MTLEDLLSFIEAHKENWSNGKFFFIRCPSYYVPIISNLYGFNPNCCWEPLYCSKCNKEVDTMDIGENGAYINDNKILCFMCFLKEQNRKKRKKLKRS